MARTRRLRGLVLAVLASLVWQGCGLGSLYYWGGYEESLFQRYVGDDDARAYALMSDTIVHAEQASQRPAPGIYADYGFLLYQRRDDAGAIKYFEKEAAAYPESAALMQKLIDRVRQQGAAKDDAGEER